MSSNPCPICLEELENKNIVVLDCEHNFHINCYTNYVIHKVQDMVNEIEPNEIKCPMCRNIDANMLIPMLQTIQGSVEKEMNCNMFVDDMEDIIVKRLYPLMFSVLDGSRRFTKSNLTLTLRKVIKDNEKVVKEIFKDYRS